MKLRFLCGHHRQWLLENPGAALGAWQQASDGSLQLLEAGRLNEATNYAGCALETSDILLSQHAEPCDQHITRFSRSAIRLAHLLVEINQATAAGTVLAGALSRLQSLLGVANARTALMRALDQLSATAEQLQLPHEPPRGAALH